MSKLSISIITVTYNSKVFIRDCLSSVVSQSLADVEHVIIDGDSTDETLQVISSFSNHVKKLVSEPDDGIYDAMNKGISLASGDIVGILNSDDVYASESILQEIADIFERQQCDLLYGNLEFVSQENLGKVIRKWIPGRYVNGSFMKGWHPPHPTFFVRKEVYERFGYYDTSLDVSADFELMFRFMEKNHLKFTYFDKTIVKMRYGGESTGSLRKIIRGNINVMKAFRKNGYRVPLFYPVMRLFPKLKQFIKH